MPKLTPRSAYALPEISPVTRSCSTSGPVMSTASMFCAGVRAKVPVVGRACARPLSPRLSRLARLPSRPTYRCSDQCRLRVGSERNALDELQQLDHAVVHLVHAHR